jgi:transcriptional regulator with XRE-family HTH domain
MAPGDPAQRFLEAFGRAVHERRAFLSLSQEQLGFRADLDRTYLSGIECGRRNPTLRSLWTIAAALETTPDVLIAAAVRLSTQAK